MKRINLFSIAIAIYGIGFVVAFGHYASRTDLYPDAPPYTNRSALAAMDALVIGAVWPLYVSTQIWEQARK